MGKEHVMPTRELVADDVVQSLTRSWNARPIAWTKDGGAVDSISADGKYDVVVEFSRFDGGWTVWCSGNPNAIYAPEVVEAGAGDWENLVGTGPFVFKEYVTGSHMTYARNPDYWGSPTTINGTEYEIPFVDEMIYPLIADMSTRISALRTGKYDIYYKMPIKYKETLAQSTPELQMLRYLTKNTKAIGLMCDREPFNNKELRRAMWMALDTEAIAKAVFLEAKTGPDIFPVLPGFAGYIPYEELTPTARELFEYNPERAREIMAEQGYPEGVRLKVTALDAGGFSDIFAMAKAYWEAIGVDLEIKQLEWLSYANELRDPESYQLRDSWGTNTMDIESTMGKHGSNWAAPLDWNNALWTDPAMDKLCLEVNTFDAAERDAIKAEAARIIVEEAVYIPICLPYEVTYWWPWVKNYYGEFETTYDASSNVEASIWIDHALKEEMGY
jgi:peptide/nickel transport system substrate-binding protein